MNGCGGDGGPLKHGQGVRWQVVAMAAEDGWAGTSEELTGQ